MSRADLYSNPRKTLSTRELGPVEIGELRSAVLDIPQSLWDEENAAKPNRFQALDRTQHIAFRFVRDFVDWRDSFERPLWEEWRPLVEPVLRQAIKPYGYERGAFPRIMLARMAPGGVIQPHQDLGIAAKWPHKIHVPLVTNPQVTFFIDDTGYYFPEGHAVEVNNMAMHGVTNDGGAHRIHLIFEYFDTDQPPPDWLEQVKLERAMRAPRVTAS